MSLSARIAIVLGVVAVVAIVVIVARMRPLTRVRRIEAAGLGRGVHLFTSQDCGSCVDARELLRQRADDFTEWTWGADPEVFERVGIDAVPSVVVVAEDGTARWHRGGVPRRSQIPGDQRPTE